MEKILICIFVAAIFFSAIYYLVLNLLSVRRSRKENQEQKKPTPNWNIIDWFKESLTRSLQYEKQTVNPWDDWTILIDRMKHRLKIANQYSEVRPWGKFIIDIPEGETNPLTCFIDFVPLRYPDHKSNSMNFKSSQHAN